MTTTHEAPAGRPATTQRVFGQTPSQTVGPFFGLALPYEGGSHLVPPHSRGSIRIHGTVYDGSGAPVPDAMVEIWQADAAGSMSSERGSLERDGYTFTGFGRTGVDGAGQFTFATVKPGATRPGAAPHVLITVFARGLLHHLFTRAYFSDETTANDNDQFLASIDPSRRETLVAVADGVESYRFDIRLQGEGETVFLEFPEA
ncbi:protocatechuate 3,4-dioxygenase subunit alpha [Okibacterium endophyticum]